jgi:putative hydrolase of the HAD superfamily
VYHPFAGDGYAATMTDGTRAFQRERWRVAIETVFLDAGGVLLFPNWDRVADTLRRHGMQVAPGTLRAVEPAVKFAIDDAAGVASTNDAQRGGTYFDGVLDAAGVPRSRARDTALLELYDYHATRNLWEYVPDDVRPALESLREAGFKLAVVSNANGLVRRVFERNGMAQTFDAICDSCLEGIEKPDPRLFRIALERTNSRAEATLHVGDLFHVDVVGARNAGLQAVLVDPHGLYGAFDVPRVATLQDLVDRLCSSRHRAGSGAEGGSAS